MNILLIIIVSVIGGFGIAWVLLWGQQFGNTAAAAEIRKEMDRRRELRKQKEEAKKTGAN